MLMVTFVPSQTSAAVGGVNDQGVPHSTVAGGAQTMVGGVESTMRTVWPHVDRLVNTSNVSQVRVTLKVLPQNSTRLVTVLTMRNVGLGSQLSKTVGASKFQ